MTIHASEFEYIALRIGNLASISLYEELSLFPKPGLVSFIDSGSHKDMNAQTFLKSIDSLHWYFKDITKAGALSYRFDELKKLGKIAEKRMLDSTKGINTHRGAIFCLGMLCAAAGMCYQKCGIIDHDVLRKELILNWGKCLQEHANGPKKDHILGARLEAALGMPSVFEIGIPKLKECIAAKMTLQQALIETLINLMARLYDTNVIRRAGQEGLNFVQQQSRLFIKTGGTLQAHWQQELWQLHQDFKAKNITPGGSADILAASLFVYILENLKW